VAPATVSRRDRGPELGRCACSGRTPDMSTDGAVYGPSREPEPRSSRARRRQSPKGHRRHGRGRCPSQRKGAELGRRRAGGTSVQPAQSRPAATTVFENKRIGLHTSIRRVSAVTAGTPGNDDGKTRHAGTAEGRRRVSGGRGEPAASATG
jgi:hypothetical protein